ncbi:LCP family protein [Plantibacter flavus]|uniref:LCP family protein n=1 Tax=Plantibacter flavus TaxID=150123 RepID=UPI003F177325
MPPHAPEVDEPSPERSTKRRPAKLATIARHGRLKRSNPFATGFKILASTLAVALVSGGIVAGIALWDVAASVKPGVALVGADGQDVTAAALPAIGAYPGGVNLLIVGSDSRAGQDPVFGDETVETGNLNDVTMLVHISEDHSNATVVSFPRDLFVSIPSCPDPEGGSFSSMSRQKINTSLSYGGLACTALTVSQLTGLEIPFAAEVQFSGVMAMSTALGGVTVCVADPIEDEYTNTFLAAGEHTLEGYEALQFLRTRHGVGDGSDLSRISNQQVFLSAMMQQVKSAETLTNPAILYSLAKAAAQNMQLSDSLTSLDTMTAIAMTLREVDLANIAFVQYPNAAVENGVEPIEPAATALFEALSNDQPIQLTGATGAGSVANPAGPVPADPAEAADPAADPAATTVPTDASASGPVVLPSTVQGQTADQRTCSRGRTLDDQ